ncbi:MAG: hypothetical protein R3B84_03315 [Zavarzinella sp.]
MTTPDPEKLPPNQEDLEQTEQLIAFLDQELEDDEAEQIAAQLSIDPKLRAEAETHQRTWDILDFLPRAKPSESFTQNTVSMIIPVGASSSATNQQTLPATGISPTRNGGMLFPILCVLVCLIAGVGSYQLRNRLFPTQNNQVDSNQMMVDHLSLLQNMRLYREVDSLEFIQELSKPELFGTDFRVGYGNLDKPFDANDRNYLRRQLAFLLSLPVERQQQLQAIDQQFRELDAGDQEHHKEILKIFNQWLNSLPVENQKKIREAPTNEVKLGIIQQLREKDFLSQLPERQRTEVQALPADIRGQKLAEIRTTASQNEQHWAITSRFWLDVRDGRTNNLIPRDLRPQIDALIKNLLPMVNSKEAADLDQLQRGDEETLALLVKLIELTEKYPILPGGVGPANFADLSPENQEYLRTHDQNFGGPPDSPIQGRAETKDLKRAENKRPRFGEELAKYLRKKKLTLPQPLGPTNRTEMPAMLQPAISNLERVLAKNQTNRLEELRAAEGKWPEYPKLVLELARQQKIHLPGVMLPGILGNKNAKAAKN